MGTVIEFHAGETVRRKDTNRVATFIELQRPWDLARIQYQQGEEDWLSIYLLERVTAAA